MKPSVTPQPSMGSAPSDLQVEPSAGMPPRMTPGSRAALTDPLSTVLRLAEDFARALQRGEYPSPSEFERLGWSPTQIAAHAPLANAIARKMVRGMASATPRAVRGGLTATDAIVEWMATDIALHHLRTGDWPTHDDLGLAGWRYGQVEAHGLKATVRAEEIVRQFDGGIEP